MDGCKLFQSRGGCIELGKSVAHIYFHCLSVKIVSKQWCSLLVSLLMVSNQREEFFILLLLCGNEMSSCDNSLPK